MIFGKISPVLSMVTQDALFNPTAEFVTGSYITAVASPYPLGANRVNFRISYGNCEFESGSVTSFKSIHQDNITLLEEDIASWGTDDSIILDLIAERQGTEVIELVSGSAPDLGF
jgi:hypothetical protein